MDAVFVDVIMDYTFCLPTHALCSSALSFHILHSCWVSPRCLLSTTILLDFHRRNVIKYTFNFWVKRIKEKIRVSRYMLGFKATAFINSTLVF